MDLPGRRHDASHLWGGRDLGQQPLAKIARDAGDRAAEHGHCTAPENSGGICR